MTQNKSHGDLPRVRSVIPPDVDRLAELHAQGLADSFLPRLGPKFLREMYVAMLSSPVVFGFAAGGDVADGFVICTTDRVVLGQVIDRRRGRLLLAALPRLVARPSLIGRLVSGLSYARHAHPCPAELVVIVVDESARSQGCGQALFIAARDEFRKRGCERFSVTVTAENAGARRFYERYGMKLNGALPVFGREMAEYVG